MARAMDEDELIEHWTLIGEELARKADGDVQEQGAPVPAGWPARTLRYTVIGVTAQELAISAYPNRLNVRSGSDAGSSPDPAHGIGGTPLEVIWLFPQRSRLPRA